MAHQHISTSAHQHISTSLQVFKVWPGGRSRSTRRVEHGDECECPGKLVPRPGRLRTSALLGRCRLDRVPGASPTYAVPAVRCVGPASVEGGPTWATGVRTRGTSGPRSSPWRPDT